MPISNRVVRWTATTMWSIGVVATAAHGTDDYLPCIPEPTDMSIAVGDIVNCTIDPVTDSDILRFQGVAGETIQLTLLDTTGGSGHPIAEVYDPAQAAIDTLVVNDGGVRAFLTPAQTGTYTLLLRENGDNQTATYVVALQRVSPAPDEAVTLCYDCVLGGAIDVPGDSDVLLFEGVGGETVMLTLTDTTGGSGHPIAEVFDPHGALLTTLVINDSGERQLHELAESGTYTVLMRENGDNQAATWQFGLQRVLPLSEDCDAYVPYDTTLMLTVDPVADSDVLWFDAAAGTTIRLTVTDTTGGSGHPIVEVFDPQGNVVTTLAQNDGAAAWQVVVDSSGRYAVLVRENGDNQVATLNLHLQCLFGGCPTGCTGVEPATWGRIKGSFR